MMKQITRPKQMVKHLQNYINKNGIDFNPRVYSKNPLKDILKNLIIVLERMENLSTEKRCAYDQKAKTNADLDLLLRTCKKSSFVQKKKKGQTQTSNLDIVFEKLTKIIQWGKYKEYKQYSKLIKNSIFQTKKQNQRLKQLITQLKSQLSQKEEQINKQFQQLQNELADKKKQIQQLQNDLTDQKKQIQQLRINLTKKDLRPDLKDKDKQIESLKKNSMGDNDSKVYRTKFYCNIMQDQYLYQEYLTQILNKFIGRNIKFTKLIYQWHPLHKTKVQDYIVDIPHLVFLIQTEEEYHIAAYTEMPFSQKIEPGKGAIISLTNRRAFPTKEGVRAISYDRAFVRFGNTELQIKDNEINSILGTAGGKYQSGSERADILFGRVEKARTKIAAMEVFQLMF